MSWMYSPINSVMSEWNQQSLNNICECYNCKQGITTQQHSQQSHDQSLYQKIPFNNNIINITGGTTKCARIFVQYLTSAIQHQHDCTVDTDIIDLTNGGNVVVELGAGTGLVSIACNQLNNTVLATDQEPLLELLQPNIQQNTINHNDTMKSIQVYDLLWNDRDSIHNIQNQLQPYDTSKLYIIGVDLIYAKECISDLVHTYIALYQYTNTVCYLVYISRFEWEKQFFTEMQQNGFHSVCVHTVDEIEIWKFKVNNT